MHVTASAAKPPVIANDFAARQNGPDGGLLSAYVAGLRMASQQPQLAARARQGELPTLPFKGGTDKALKNNSKFGPLAYLAMWQGLRGDDLDIDTTQEYTLQCTATGLAGTYTPDAGKYLNEE